MNRSCFSLVLALFLIAALGSSYAFAKKKKIKTDASSVDRVIIQYSGILQDRRGAAIGGVYPIQFSLYKSERSRRAAWTETHWVAIDYGRYTVELGNARAIPKKFKLDKAFIGVKLVGVAEVLRERLVIAGETTRPKPTRHSENRVTPPPGGKRVESADFAEKAEFAYNAGDAERLSNMTVEELRVEFANPVKIGKKVWTSRSAGGTGGDEEFELRCPKGQIAIGIRGMEGKFIDSMQLVCAPIE